MTTIELRDRLNYLLAKNEEHANYPLVICGCDDAYETDSPSESVDINTEIKQLIIQQS